MEKEIETNELCKACKSACKQTVNVKICSCDFIRKQFGNSVIVKVKEK